MDAVLPLIGVVIGAVLGGGMTFLLDRRRERRAATAGRRLVALELQAAQSTWKTHTDEWHKNPTAETADWVISDLKERRLARAQWRSYQEVLASSLSDDDWEALTNAYSLIRLVDAAAHQATAEDMTEVPGQMEESKWVLDKAIQRLQRDTGPPVGPEATT
jgi:hypothetical protein